MPTATAPQQLPNPQMFGGASSGGPGIAGYNAALGSLGKSLNLLQGSDQSQMMQAQNQLAQSQGQTQQHLINSGLGNTTVAQTMQQAPLQTYNQNIANIQDNLAKQQSGVYGQAAGIQAQGGNQMNQYSQFLQSLLAQQQNQQQKTAASTSSNLAPNYVIPMMG